MSVSRTISGGNFAKQLAFGQIAETDIAKWIIKRGGYVLPIYDIEYETGKGPRLFGPERNIVAPDLLVIDKHRRVCWVEAKHKTVFSWHRKTRQWVTGIDRHHYLDYCKVASVVDWPVWLLFLHRSSTPSTIDRQYDGCPERCPTGLYGETIDVLKKPNMQNHSNRRHGKSGMVYWRENTLRKLADIDEI